MVGIYGRSVFSGRSTFLHKIHTDGILVNSEDLVKKTYEPLQRKPYLKNAQSLWLFTLFGNNTVSELHLSAKCARYY